ncbi:hypothetical protein JCGZ_08830 [Jatropha curcas]|uniref:Uncharacterized protein n=1 Tax=Jatropha curcas TaxID=180498 RepID=A0A067KIY2_JATCU|nr:hypothetical protein JCGZ_08830 [Jatropha curcas]
MRARDFHLKLSDSYLAHLALATFKCALATCARNLSDSHLAFLALAICKCALAYLALGLQALATFIARSRHTVNQFVASRLGLFGLTGGPGRGVTGNKRQRTCLLQAQPMEHGKEAIDSSDRSQGSEFEVRQRSVATDLFEFKEEMLYMKREMMKMYSEIVTIGGKRECLESEIGSLKKLIFICLMTIMMLFTLLVMLLFKGNRGL